MTTGRQREIEARYLRLAQPPPAPTATVAEVFGAPGEWELAVGRHRLMLWPSGEWLWHDPRHDAWKRTGLGPGEAEFADRDGRLIVTRPPGAPRLRADRGADRWHVRQDGRRLGPMPAEEIIGRLGRGELSERTPIRRVGTPLWLRAGMLLPAAAAVSPATARERLCGKCGSRARATAKFCGKCGTAL